MAAAFRPPELLCDDLHQASFNQDGIELINNYSKLTQFILNLLFSRRLDALACQMADLDLDKPNSRIGRTSFHLGLADQLDDSINIVQGNEMAL